MTNPTEVEKLIERMKDTRPMPWDDDIADDCAAAATMLEAQAAEIARLREALEHWNAQAAAWMEARDHFARPGWMQLALEKARKALATPEGEG